MFPPSFSFHVFDSLSFTFDSVLNSSGNLSFEFPTKRKLEDFYDSVRDDVSMDNRSIYASDDPDVDVTHENTDRLDAETIKADESQLNANETSMETSECENSELNLDEPGEFKRTLSSYRRERPEVCDAELKTKMCE